MSLFPNAFDSGLPASPSKVSFASPSDKAGGKNKKRKRPSSASEVPSAALKNVEKLMSRVEKGEVGGKKDGTGNMGIGLGGGGKKAKKHKGGQNGGGGRGGEPPTQVHANAPSEKGKAKVNVDIPKVNGKLAPAELPLPHHVSPASKKGKHRANGQEESLTDMQLGMKAKLEGARFRWINEQLYSHPSTEAVAMMKKDPKIFEDYHMTHRSLTSAWPSPPLPHIIRLVTPLPAGAVIVDLGCGDAGLAKALVPQGKVVLSYDLAGDSGAPRGPGEASGGVAANGDGWVVEADFLEHVPLPGRPAGADEGAGKGKTKGGGSEVVDVVVCCLSLMGTNWVGGIYEACRILKHGGTLHIAEVTSRFVSIPSFTDKIASFGFKLEHSESPSTHFTLFRFKKTSHVPIGPGRGQKGWDARVREGEEILRGCVYKKR